MASSAGSAARATAADYGPEGFVTRWGDVLRTAGRQRRHLVRIAEACVAIEKLEVDGAMLVDPAIEAIINTTPNDVHLPTTKQAAEAGKHVFLDKPIAKGGLELSRPLATAVLAVAIVVLILILPQRPGQHPGRAEAQA